MITQTDTASLNSDSEENPILEDNGVEQVEKGESGLPTKPWDPKHIRITTKNFSIREIYSQIVEGELDLAPDFQRSFVWNQRQQTRLIESILLGIPLPAFYFNQDNLGARQVIDGVQRLTTVRQFMSDALVLDPLHLEYLSTLGAVTYSVLDPALRRRFGGTQIVAHVIEPQTPDEVKYDIFNRVNTGGSPLTAQEIRHCMSKQRSREFLTRLVERESFDEATTWAFWSRGSDCARIRDNHRMSNREMALRFCAFHGVSLDAYAKASSLDAFLLEYTRRIDGMSELSPAPLNLDDLESAFERAMRNAIFILGDAAFRRWPPLASRRGPINRAIFESQAIALSEYSTEILAPHREAIALALRKLFDDPEYDSAVRTGTGDVRKLKLRLENPRSILAGLLR
jgi:hypothetical protein